MRRWSARNGKGGWEFVPTDPALKPLRVPAALKTDRDFVRWVREFPDLTRTIPEHALSTRLAANFPRRGPEELRRLINEQAIGANLLNIAAIGLSILFLFQVGTLWLAALLFALPWIAGIFVAASRGVMTLALIKGDPRPSVAIAMVLPALIFAIGPPYHTHPFAPAVLEMGAPFVGAILLALALLADRSLLRVPYGLLSYFVIFSVFAAASAVEFNVELDGSPGDVYLTTTLDKQGFSLEHPGYRVILAPWGAVSDRQTVMVSKAFFVDTLIGNQVCMSLHAGAFGLPWYMIFHCQSEGVQFTPDAFEGG